MFILTVDNPTNRRVFSYFPTLNFKWIFEIKAANHRLQRKPLQSTQTSHLSESSAHRIAEHPYCVSKLRLFG